LAKPNNMEVSHVLAEPEKTEVTDETEVSEEKDEPEETDETEEAN
jgi:hypothetical protein